MNNDKSSNYPISDENDKIRRSTTLIFYDSKPTSLPILLVDKLSCKSRRANVVYLEYAAFARALHLSRAFLDQTHHRALLSVAPEFLSITSRYFASFKWFAGNTGDAGTAKVFSSSSMMSFHQAAFSSSPSLPRSVNSCTIDNMFKR